MIFAVDDDDGIKNRDLNLGAFVAIEFQRGGHVSHGRAASAVHRCN